MFDDDEWAGPAAAVWSLTDGFVEDWSEERLLAGLAEAQALASWAKAQQSAVISELCSRDSTDHVVDLVAVELSISTRAAQQRLALAGVLDREPVLAAAMTTGRLDAGKVREIDGALLDIGDQADESELSPADRAALVTDAVKYAAGHPTPVLKRWLRRRALTADPAAAERRRERKTDERCVGIDPRADRMATLWAYGPAHWVAAVHHTVDDVARRALDQPDETRTLAQARFDALVELIRGGITVVDPAAAQTAAAAAEIVVTASADTLAGVSERPGELAGVGPVPAGTVRDLAATCSVRRREVMVVEPAAVCSPACVPDAGYRPAARTRRRVVSRSPVCVFPGCTVPAHRCDLDHLNPWPGGHTCEHNLVPLCRRHHQLKTTRAWTVRRDTDTDGHTRLVWTNRAGHEHAVPLRDWPWFDPPTRTDHHDDTHEWQPRVPDPHADAWQLHVSRVETDADGNELLDGYWDDWGQAA